MQDAARGILYLLATPIGNLADLSNRAVKVLESVDLIAAEDTRHSRPLLDHYGISKPLTPLHEHNEDQASPRLIQRLNGGDSIALISDAGTPLINDPGYPLVRLAHESGIRVVPIPGPCALITALSACGLPTHRFAFEGFPPRTRSARREVLDALAGDRRTLVFYESSHRIGEFLADIATVFQPERRLVIARELTKRHETIVATTCGEAERLVASDPNMGRGEFVVVIEGAPEPPSDEALTHEQTKVLRLLLAECSVKTAASLCAKITGARREHAYQAALALKQEAAG